MKVLFYGAGASVSAGYPVAGNLLDRIETELSQGVASVNTIDGWESFQSFLHSADEPLGRLLGNPNPEIVLTVPDLLDSAHGHERRDRWDRLREALSRGDTEEAERINAGWEEPVPQVFFDAFRAKRGFVRALDHCLGVWHWNDYENSDHRAYLHNHLSTLSTGDVVITTNWDTLIERTLLEQGRWGPADGWGVPFQLVDAHSPERQLPDSVGTESMVEVLKLHGSYGWQFGGGFTNGISQIHLRHPMFLQALPIKNTDGEQTWLKDANEPDLPSGPEMLAVIYPSYLKAVSGEQMQQVWSKATQAIADAREVEIIGSSLPSPDVALRTLLTPLRYRLSAEEVDVSVRTPDPEAQQTWLAFLGEQITIDERPLGTTAAL